MLCITTSISYIVSKLSRAGYRHNKGSLKISLAVIVSIVLVKSVLEKLPIDNIGCQCWSRSV